MGVVATLPELSEWTLEISRLCNRRNQVSLHTSAFYSLDVDFKEAK